jgi:hypothetical protein
MIAARPASLKTRFGFCADLVFAHRALCAAAILAWLPN